MDFNIWGNLVVAHNNIYLAEWGKICNFAEEKI